MIPNHSDAMGSFGAWVVGYVKSSSRLGIVPDGKWFARLLEKAEQADRESKEQWANIEAEIESFRLTCAGQTVDN